jgi:tetratricopeptide (TPR) repeat protein
MGNYQEAVQSYTLGLKYDPKNKSTKNYLEKAAKRLAAEEKAAQDNEVARTSPKTFAEEEVDEQMKMDRRRELIKQKKTKQRKKELGKSEKEAEKLKLTGNTHMSNRDFRAALDAYSAALKLCPDGPNSHVYFSNRAAAFCYLERYEEAEEDSEMSLALVPTYGKAHARLGLSRFFLGDYSGAIEAYTAALTYDPDNTASKSYLAKARARLTRQNEYMATPESLQESV